MLLDPAVDGAGDLVPGVLVGATTVAPGILRYLGPPASPTLMHLPVDDRIGIVALTRPSRAGARRVEDRQRSCQSTSTRWRATARAPR